MRHLKTTLAVLGAATILVLAGNTLAVAATGKGFILGKSNSANALTSLTRTTNGPVLKVQNKNLAAAPFALNGRGRVTNLNADKIDGLDSTALRDRAYLYTPTLAGSTLLYSAPIPVPAGTYAFSYSAFLAGVTQGNWAYCEIIKTRDGLPTYYGVTQINAGEFNPGLSGAGVITKVAGDVLEFQCGAEDDFSFQSNVANQVTMSPIAITGTASMPNASLRQVPARQAAR